MAGIGGDMFCLFYEARTKKVHALNGSGRSPASLTLDAIRQELKLVPGKGGSIPPLSALAITTPGAAAGWVDTVEKFGSGNLSLEQILTPAIELGEEGFPVSELSAKLVHFGLPPVSQPPEVQRLTLNAVENVREFNPKCISELS
jgi:gamma-glutamyltranspeptidase/glutathione hydrolase